MKCKQTFRRNDFGTRVLMSSNFLRTPNNPTNIPGGNSRYKDEEVSTWKNCLDPVLEKFLEKDIPVLEKINVFHYQENL